MTSCPECENDLDIDVEEVEEGDVVACDECGTEYEVVGVEPLELSKVEEGIDEDEDDFWKRKRRKSEREPRKVGGMGGICRPCSGDHSQRYNNAGVAHAQNLGQRNVGRPRR